MSLEFRELKETDLKKLQQWRVSPEVTKYLLTDPVITVEGQLQWYKGLKDALYWIINFEGVDIGYASLVKIDKKNRRGDPGMYIGNTEYRGRGLGKRIMRKIEKHAFETLDLHKLYGPVLSENYSALVSYLKCGWKVEGVLRDHVFKHDKFYDVYMIALLRSDWIK